MPKQAIIIDKWKKEVTSLLRAKYGDKLKENKIDKALDDIIENRMQNKKCVLYNNYAHAQVNTDLLSITDAINKNNLIMGGDGVLFIQHALIKNPIIRYIMELMDLRKYYKKMRTQYKKYTPEWSYFDLMQLNTKIKINSLYGVLGYKKFHFFNIFLAKAVTSFGQNIISTAACAFENFLSDNIKFVSTSELYHYIMNIVNEVKEKYSDMDFSVIPEKSIEEVKNRLKNKSVFKWSDDLSDSVQTILENSSNKVKKLLYYKNNLYEFSRVPFIKSKLKFILNNTEKLLAPDTDLIENPSVKDMVDDVWKFYKTFVLYDYPAYDRIRKTKYTKKKSVLYIDTDSNFLALEPWVKFSKNEVLNGAVGPDVMNLEFIIVNLITIYTTRVVSSALFTMCKSLNISDEYAKRLQMKNEFFFRRIVFGIMKKRYFSLMILQEGNLLNDGKGFTEFKGFDFIKSNTKETVRNKYKDICLNEILLPEKINTEKVYAEVLDFKNEIDKALKNGETKFYKQQNVKVVENYKYPSRVQGIRGIVFWNTLCPQYAIQLPSDVDIVPINLDTKQGLKNFSEKYPNECEALLKQVREAQSKMIVTDSKGVTKMPEFALNVIAKPKNPDIILPDWFYDIIDYEKIELDALALFYPILESIGIQTLKTNSNTTHISNIVSL